MYIKKNTSHISQQPINAVDTGNLSLHIPHALGSGGEQSLPVTKGHCRIFASIPRSFSSFLVPTHYCEEKSKSWWWFFKETWELFTWLSRQSSRQPQNAVCLDEWRRSSPEKRTSNYECLMKSVTEINCLQCLKVWRNYWSKGNGLSVCLVEWLKSFPPDFP